MGIDNGRVCMDTPSIACWLFSCSPQKRGFRRGFLSSYEAQNQLILYAWSEQPEVQLSFQTRISAAESRSWQRPRQLSQWNAASCTLLSLLSLQHFLEQKSPQLLMAPHVPVEALYELHGSNLHPSYLIIQSVPA